MFAAHFCQIATKGINVKWLAFGVLPIQWGIVLVIFSAIQHFICQFSSQREPPPPPD
jgi:hypothetical protein